MRHLTILLLFLFLVSCSGCNQEALATNLLSMVDSKPPLLLEAETISDDTATIRFDETIHSAAATSITNPVANVTFSGPLVTITFSQALRLGETITLEGRVKDKRGNSTRFSTRLWANNPDRAELRINEITTRGTETQPDRVELLVTRSGNISGIVVSDGPGGNRDNHCILPSKHVWEGEYVVVQFQKGISEAPYQSEELSGLKANNGCVMLSTTPFSNAKIMDAVAYNSMETETQEGWGTQAVLERIKHLVEKGAWKSMEKENAVDNRKSTSTRSLNRAQEDTGEKQSDWYVCPQGEASFGGKNSLNRYP